MKLTKIDLSGVVAIAHNNGQLGVLIDRGEEIEYIEIPAPEAAYDGLQQLSNFANNRAILGGEQYPKALQSSLPLDRCGGGCFSADGEEDGEDEALIELERGESGEDIYYPADLDGGECLDEANPRDQLLKVRVPGYSLE